MNYSDLSSMMTVVMMTVFIGIVRWAWSSKRRDEFDAAARVPLEDDSTERILDARQSGKGR